MSEIFHAGIKTDPSESRSHQEQTCLRRSPLLPFRPAFISSHHHENVSIPEDVDDRENL